VICRIICKMQHYGGAEAVLMHFKADNFVV